MVMNSNVQCKSSSKVEEQMIWNIKCRQTVDIAVTVMMWSAS